MMLNDWKPEKYSNFKTFIRPLKTALINGLMLSSESKVSAPQTPQRARTRACLRAAAWQFENLQHGQKVRPLRLGWFFDCDGSRPPLAGLLKRIAVMVRESRLHKRSL